MAQGKAWNKDKIISEVLKPIFQLGYSVNKASEVAGIPQRTVNQWLEDDEELRLKVNTWQNEPNLLARKQWVKALEYGIDKQVDTYTPAKDWLERREKADFSTKTEQDIRVKELPKPILGGMSNALSSNNGDSQATETKE